MQLPTQDLESELIVFAVGTMDFHKWIHVAYRAVNGISVGARLANLQSHIMRHSHPNSSTRTLVWLTHSPMDGMKSGMKHLILVSRSCCVGYMRVEKKSCC